MEDLYINVLAGFIFALIFIPLGRWYLKRKTKNQIEADDKKAKTPEDGLDLNGDPFAYTPDFLSKEEIKETISTSPIDIPKEIERYFELKDKGIITEEEFNKKKTELLK